MRMTDILHILRNPYGHQESTLSTTRIEAAYLIEQLATENAALKVGKDQYKHFKGNEYTVLFDDVYDSAVGPDAVPDVVYVGKNGVKWRRSAPEFHGYKNGVRRFNPITTGHIE